MSDAENKSQKVLGLWGITAYYTFVADTNNTETRLTPTWRAHRLEGSAPYWQIMTPVAINGEIVRYDLCTIQEMRICPERKNRPTECPAAAYAAQ